MKKIDIGELVNKSYANSEVIEYINNELIDIVKNMVKDCDSNSWSGIGASINQLGQLSVILQSLNENVNGKKEKVVL